MHISDGHKNVRLDKQLEFSLRAASCRIITSSEDVGTGVLCRFYAPAPAQVEAKNPLNFSILSHLCILTCHTLIPTSNDARQATFEFHHPNENLSRRQLVDQLFCVLFVVSLYYS